MLYFSAFLNICFYNGTQRDFAFKMITGEVSMLLGYVIPSIHLWLAYSFELTNVKSQFLSL